MLNQTAEDSYTPVTICVSSPFGFRLRSLYTQGERINEACEISSVRAELACPERSRRIEARTDALDLLAKECTTMLPPTKNRCPLLQKRGHPFAKIFAHVRQHNQIVVLHETARLLETANGFFGDV